MPNAPGNGVSSSIDQHTENECRSALMQSVTKDSWPE